VKVCVHSVECRGYEALFLKIPLAEADVGFRLAKVEARGFFSETEETETRNRHSAWLKQGPPKLPPDNLGGPFNFSSPNCVAVPLNSQSSYELVLAW